MAAQGSVRFDRFELEQGSDRLRRNGSEIDLQPQPARLLRHLVERSGEVVSRDELVSRLWGTADDPRLDQRLHFCIAQIRRALGDSAEQPSFIETVPRRGYRFLLPVRPASRRWRPAALLFAVAVVALTVAAALWSLIDRSSAVLEVIPFGVDRASPMSAARLSDRLRDELVRVADGDLRVAAPVDGADAAAQADFSVEGRVSASADGLRVAIRLRRAADDVYLWADHYLIPAGSVDGPPAWLRDVARIIEERAGRE